MIDGELFEGKYRILKTLGKGGMSTVYLAENIKLGTLWAIKQINKKPHSKIDILIEPNILKKLSHPALPRIFDITEDEDNIYVVVDYLDGISLDKKLENEGKFPEKTVIEWMKQICSVLEYLHTFKPNPIIYRDMKPSNIMLMKDGTVKLIDFGIAREFKTQSQSDTIYIGTKGYAAPEQYGIGQTNATTDIYSLGVTVYHLLTGKGPNEPPYDIKPVRFFDKSLSKGIEHIVSGCTRKNPEERYQSVQELLNDINNIEEFSQIKNNNIDVFETQKVLNKYVNFKKLVLTIWDNQEFACEIAYITAKLTKFKVLLVNLDFFSNKIDIYLNIRHSPKEGLRHADKGLDILFDCMESASLTGQTIESACFRKSELHNLYILSEGFNYKSYETYKAKDISKILDHFYRYFDVTIITVNKSLADSFTITCLHKSDYNLIAASGTVDEINEYREYLEFIESEYGIPPDKTKFVAWEYKKRINLSKGILKNVFNGNSFIGCINYDSEREAYRNLNNTFYAKWACKKHINDYREILEAFNIVPKTSFVEKLIQLFTVNKNMAREISEFEKEKNRLKHEVEEVTIQAVTDPLTGIYNRNKFNRELEAQINISKRALSRLAVIMFDIDHFKKINDGYGHDCGDAVLKALSKIVKNSIRTNDTFARWGGEEFIILLPGMGLEAAFETAERLRINVSKHEFDRVQKISCSFGVAELERERDTGESFIKRADLALYAAKGSGRNCVKSQSEM